MPVTRVCSVNDSSNISWISYDTEEVIRVHYKSNDSIYKYENCSLSLFGLIVGSDSVGVACKSLLVGKAYSKE